MRLLERLHAAARHPDQAIRLVAYMVAMTTEKDSRVIAQTVALMTEGAIHGPHAARQLAARLT